MTNFTKEYYNYKNEKHYPSTFLLKIFDIVDMQIFSISGIFILSLKTRFSVSK